MKKTILLLLMSMSLSLTIHAQSAQSRLDLPENQKIMGHYESDAIGTEGAGVSSASGKVTVGVILESEEIDIFNGGKILAFRVGLAESTPISKVFVQPVTAGGTYGTMVSWACEANEVGWNVIELPAPYQLDIPAGGQLMIGFEYEQPTKTSTPLAMAQEGDIYDTYYYKKAGQQYRWTLAGLRPYGNLCVQCIVEREHYPEVLVRASGLETLNFANLGDMLPFSFSVKNRGTNVLEAQALTFDVKIDGEKVATVSNPEAIAPGAVITIQDSVATDDLASGNHTLTIDNAVAGDEELDYVYPLNASFMAFSGVYPRQKHMIEQFTSTYCTYCPMGTSMLRILTSSRDDIIWVGVHGNLNGGVDPFSTNQGDSVMAYMNANSYPSAAFDRHTGWEYADQLVNVISYYEEYHEQIAEELGAFFDNISAAEPTFASISITSMVDAGTREGTVTVSGELTSDFDALMGDDCKLTVYLTEDSLIARQLNSGSWVSTYQHNGVFRCALGSVKGVDLARTDDGYCNEFSVTVPEAWNLSNLNVVAFISRPLTNGIGGKYSDMYVINAESARVVNSLDGVEEILTDDDAVPVEYYDVMGRRMNTPAQGINIVRMSNGTTKKVLVR